MTYFNEAQIQKTRNSLASTLAIDSIISVIYGCSGVRMANSFLIGKDIAMVMLGVTIALTVFATFMAIQMVRLYLAPVHECSKIGNKGKGRFMSGIFESPQDYVQAVAKNDERVMFTVMMNIYFIGTEIVHDYGIIGKYAECLWIVQGLLMSVVAKSSVPFTFACGVVIAINCFSSKEELSFEGTVVRLPKKIMQDSEK